MSGAGNFGERQESDARDWGFFAHLSIYQFASRFVTGKRCLEIGCGTGYGTEHLLQAGPLSMVALDKEEKAVQLLRRKGLRAECFACDLDIDGLDVAGHEFDFVFSSNVFEHLAYPDDLLGRIAGVLTADGSALIAVPPICTPGMLDANAHNIFHINNIPPWAWRSKLYRYFHSVTSVRHWVREEKVDHLGQIRREDVDIDDFVFTEEPALGFETITSIFLAQKPRDNPLPPDELAENCPAWWRPKKIEADARQRRLTGLLQNIDEARRWSVSNRAKGVDPNFILDGIQRHLLLLTGGDESDAAAAEDSEHDETGKTSPPVRRTPAYPPIDDSVLGCIVTGFSKGGTTLVKDMILHTTNMFGCFECGLLLSQNPFNAIGIPWSDNLLQAWKLEPSFWLRYRACNTFEDGYRLLRSESAKVKCKDAPLIDKLPEYLLNLGSTMRRAPGTPVVIVVRDPVATAVSWVKWGNPLEDFLEWMSKATVALIAECERTEHISPLYLVRLEDLIFRTDETLEELQIWLRQKPRRLPKGCKLGLPNKPARKAGFPVLIELERHSSFSAGGSAAVEKIRTALAEHLPLAERVAALRSGPLC